MTRSEYDDFILRHQGINAEGKDGQALITEALEILTKCFLVTELAGKLVRFGEERQGFYSDFIDTVNQRNAGVLSVEELYEALDFSGFERYGRKKIDEMYAEITKPCISFAARDSEIRQRKADDYLQYSNSVFGIAAAVCAEGILVRLPLVGSMWRALYEKTEVSSGAKTYSRIFKNDVEISVGNALQGIASGQMDSFKEKTLSYFFVYPGAYPFPLDSDNHDIKTITDAVTGLLPGGDASTACSFFLTTVRSDEIPQGTYVVVSPGSSSPQSRDGFLKMMKDRDPFKTDPQNKG